MKSLKELLEKSLNESSVISESKLEILPEHKRFIDKHISDACKIIGKKVNFKLFEVSYYRKSKGSEGRDIKYKFCTDEFDWMYPWILNKKSKYHFNLYISIKHDLSKSWMYFSAESSDYIFNGSNIKIIEL